MEKISFACDSCGQQLAVREEHAGRRVRCTTCQNVMLVPSAPHRGRRVAEEPPRDSYRETRGPAPRRERDESRPSDFDFDEPARGSRGAGSRARGRDEVDGRRDADDYDDRAGERRSRRRGAARPSRRKKGGIAGGGAGLIALIALALVVLAGGGIGIYYLFSGGVDEDLKLVPDDAVGFLSVKPADLKDSYWIKKLIDDKVIPEKEFTNSLLEQTGGFDFKISDLERVTMFLNDVEDSPRPTTIVSTKKSFKKEAVLEQFEKKHGNGEKSGKDKHEGKDYFVINDQAIYFHSASLFVFGPEQGVKSSIAAGQGKGKKGLLNDAKEVASKSSYQMAVGFNAKHFGKIGKLIGGNPLGNLAGGLGAGGFPGLPGGAGNLQANSIEAVYFAAGISRDVDVVAGVTFDDSDAAKKVATDTRKARDEFIKMIKSAKSGARGASSRDVNLVIDFFEGIDIDQSGKSVKFAVNVDSDLIERAYKEIKGLKGGGGFPLPF